MLAASLILFGLALTLPTILVTLPKSESSRVARAAYMPNLAFILITGSFVTGISHGFTISWSFGLLVYLAFEGYLIVVTIRQFVKKERMKNDLLRQSESEDQNVRERALQEQDTETITRGEHSGGCNPRIIADTQKTDAQLGWAVSSLFSWHVYVYKLQILFSVDADILEVTAKAENYDMTWFDLNVVGIGLITVNPLLAMIGAGSIQFSYSEAKKTSRAVIVCLETQDGCLLQPTVDPPTTDQEDEVTAGVVIRANRVSPDIVHFTLSGVTTLSGHVTVQRITVGGTLGASTAIPGIGAPATPSTSPITITAGINANVQLVPSPGARRTLSEGRAVTIRCERGEAGTST